MYYANLWSFLSPPPWSISLLLSALVLGCGGAREEPSSVANPAPAPPSPEQAQAFAEEGLFVEAGEEIGLEFSHFNGMSGEMYFHEMMGAGAAFFDYDGDGDLDVYLVQGHPLGSRKEEGPPMRDRLFRNDRSPDGEGGSQNLRFTDVTEASGIDARGYGMGVAGGDIDNDGWQDLYVTNFRGNQLWRNRGWNLREQDGRCWCRRPTLERACGFLGLRSRRLDRSLRRQLSRFLCRHP